MAENSLMIQNKIIHFHIKISSLWGRFSINSQSSTEFILPCGVKAKIKAQYYMLPWYLVKLGRLQRASSEVFLLWIRYPKQTTLFIKGFRHSSYIFLSSGFQFFACGIIQTNQLHLLMGNRRYCTLLLLQSLPSMALSYLLCFWVQSPCGPAWSSWAVSICD